jgi:hypothetical protein
MSISKATKRALTALAATASALALSAAPAFAGTDAHARSTSEDCGVLGCITVEHREAWFYSNGDHWKVCDTYPDGDRAMMSVYWEDSAGNHIIYTSATGGECDCKPGNHNIPEGAAVTLQVWHQNGANGIVKDRRTAHGKA